jgi:hypothetical protein
MNERDPMESNLMREHPIEWMSEYLDGELSPARRAALESHLPTCAECTRTLAELRAVVSHAHALPDSPAPDALWAGIEARLQPRRREVIDLRSAGAWVRRLSFTVPQLAAAGLVLALFSGGGVWLALRGVSSASGPVAVAPAPSIATTPSAGTTGPRTPMPTSTPTATPGNRTQGDATLAAFDAERYDHAVAELQGVLDQNRGRLDPATVRTVETNLALIDRAIGQARQALLADPSNPYLNGHLADQMKRKIRVLQRAADAVTAEMRAANS